MFAGLRNPAPQAIQLALFLWGRAGFWKRNVPQSQLNLMNLITGGAVTLYPFNHQPVFRVTAPTATVQMQQPAWASDPSYALSSLQRRASALVIPTEVVAIPASTG